jgi:hypothetical protein
MSTKYNTRHHACGSEPAFSLGLLNQQSFLSWLTDSVLWMPPPQDIDSTPLPRWAEARKINIVHIWRDYTNNNKHCRRNISSKLQKTNAKTLHYILTWLTLPMLHLIWNRLFGRPLLVTNTKQQWNPSYRKSYVSKSSAFWVWAPRTCTLFSWRYHLQNFVSANSLHISMKFKQNH